ncbi:YgiT-type zinc finger protein [Calderihabitans maritimus]|uniref:YgiT-type zinc finger domain-containing protein n=1 Tax=Calderihabitans maritimus TaxID=1246530 RepID=A0A1Z5HW32_9FIRM|nr:YgiT-type zinc finger protein [Calderihabitans maritimus]GAW93525.1 hypothetical protein Daud_0511 [Calderihabitans maritimus]
MNRCYLCWGSLEKKRVEVIREKDGRMIVIKDVPAEVCNQCGEKYFGPEATFRMRELLEAQEVPGEKTISVPVRSFDALKLSQVQK